MPLAVRPGRALTNRRTHARAKLLLRESRNALVQAEDFRKWMPDKDSNLD